MRFLTSIFLISATSAALSASAQTKKLTITTGLQATINHAEGSKTVQVLIPGVEAIELDLVQPPNTTFTIKTADYNFDGYKDFALAGAPGANGVQVYDIFLYHPADKSFEALEWPGGVCELPSNIRLNAADKTLKSSCRTNGKASTDIFKWTTPFAVELTKCVDNSADAQQDAADAKRDKKTDKEEQLQDKREERKDKKAAKKEESDDE